MKWLFLPGLACRSEIWEGVAEHLPEVDPVALDWPHPERLASMDDAARWLGAQIDRHQPTGVTGHSFGGIVALHLFGQLERRPLLPLVVVDSFLVDPDPFFHNHVWEGPNSLRLRVSAMLESERPRFPMLRKVAMAPEEPLQWREAALDTGAAFVFGGRGGEHSDSDLRALAGVPAVAGNPVFVVPRTSHFLMLERPEEFYAIHRRLIPKSGGERGRET